MNDYINIARELFPYTRELRRDFHRHPELGFKEFRTAGIVARELGGFNLEVTTGVAKTGVVAILEGAKPGPVVMLRFDMDALPIVEETGAEYASQNPGVMHACGHDGHTAVGLTVARILAARRDELAGTIKFIFQPAEEGDGGAEQMIAEGILENPRPDITLALHFWNDKPTGWLGISPGAIMAGAETFRIRITGKGGHGAMPHRSIDPVLASAHVITALQSIVSRNVAPLQSAVVTVTSVHGGDAFNVIPPEVELKGTIRTFETAVRTLVLERFRQIVEATASTFGCQAEIEVKLITPAVLNNPKVTNLVKQCAESLFPESSIDAGFATMGSEDWAFILREIPGCYIMIGSANQEKGLNAPHHHPKFDIDEDAIPNAVGLMSAAVVSLLSE